MNEIFRLKDTFVGKLGEGYKAMVHTARVVVPPDIPRFKEGQPVKVSDPSLTYHYLGVVIACPTNRYFRKDATATYGKENCYYVEMTVCLQDLTLSKDRLGHAYFSEDTLHPVSSDIMTSLLAQ